MVVIGRADGFARCASPETADGGIAETQPLPRPVGNALSSVLSFFSSAYLDTYRELSPALTDLSHVMAAGQKVVVVGAGPVGSLAALYAAKRGYQVELYELRSGMSVC